MTRGLVFGKFLPLHRGHLFLIATAATRCDELHIVISYLESDNKKLIAQFAGRDITKSDQLSWLNEAFGGMDFIKIHLIDESKLPPYPHGWEAWATLVKSELRFEPELVFTSEPAYDTGLKKYFPQSTHVIVDPKRECVPISATKLVEGGMIKNWEYLAGPCRAFFARRVVMVGTESCGKSTLVRYMANLYATSWAEEYGREYVRNELSGHEDELTYEDFPRIAAGHWQVQAKAMRHANRIVFIDTDAIVTQYYCQAYTGKPHPAVEEFISRQRYDLVLFLEPDLTWVADGMRLMGDERQRIKNNETIKAMYRERGIRYTPIAGSCQERLTKAIELTEHLLGSC